MRNNKGFLLLEALVSLVILTGGLLFVMRIFAVARDTLKRSGELFSYSLLAEQKLAEAELLGAVGESERAGTFREDRRLGWRLKTGPLPPEALALRDLVSARLSLYPENEPPESGYTLVTYLRMKK